MKFLDQAKIYIKAGEMVDQDLQALEEKSLWSLADQMEVTAVTGDL